MDAAEVGTELRRGVEQGQQGRQGGLGVGGLDDVGVRYVRADPVHDGLTRVHQRLHDRSHVLLGRDRRVDADQPGQLRVARSEPEGERAAHRQPCDELHLRALGQPGERLLGRRGPVRPAGGEHVLDRGPVARQTGHLHGVARSGERLCESAHRRRVAGEAVQHQHPDGSAVVAPGFGLGKNLGAGRGGWFGHGSPLGSAGRSSPVGRWYCRARLRCPSEAGRCFTEAIDRSVKAAILRALGHSAAERSGTTRGSTCPSTSS